MENVKGPFLRDKNNTKKIMLNLVLALLPICIFAIYKNGIIPYDEIKDEKEITFVIVTEDTEVLEKTISAITEVYKENKDKTFNVVISRSYEKIKEFI